VPASKQLGRRMENSSACSSGARGRPEEDDPLEALANWLTSPSNPRFARVQPTASGTN